MDGSKNKLNTIQWVFTGIGLLMAFSSFRAGGIRILSGIVLLLSAFAISPFVEKISFMTNMKTARVLLQVVVSFILCMVGLGIGGSTNSADDVKEKTPTDFTVTTTTTEATTTTETTTTETTTVTTTTTEETTATTTVTTTAVPVTEQATRAPVQQSSENYVLNTSTMKIHKPSCSDAKKIDAGNREDFYGSFEEAVNRGYSACGHCHPH